MKITVVGLGYVGLSNAIILAGGADVVALELDPDRVALVNAGRSPIVDADIEERLALGEIALTATTDAAAAYDGAEFVVVATPTDYDPDTNFFDTSSVETVIAAALAAAPDTTIVIRSTIPVGFTERMRAAVPLRTHPLRARVPPRGSGAVGQPPPEPHRRRGQERPGPGVRAPPRRGVRGPGRPRPVHRVGRGRGDQALRQHLPRDARRLLQRARHVCRVARSRHPLDHRGGRARPPDRVALQQPVLRLRRVLPAQGHQAAARQLQRGPAEPHPRHRRLQRDAQGLHRPRHPRARAGGGRDVPPRDEVGVRQLPGPRASRGS